MLISISGKKKIKCPICHKRNIIEDISVCPACRKFLTEGKEIGIAYIKGNFNEENIHIEKKEKIPRRRPCPKCGKMFSAFGQQQFCKNCTKGD